MKYEPEQMAYAPKASSPGDRGVNGRIEVAVSEVVAETEDTIVEVGPGRVEAVGAGEIMEVEDRHEVEDSHMVDGEPRQEVEPRQEDEPRQDVDPRQEADHRPAVEPRQEVDHNDEVQENHQVQIKEQSSDEEAKHEAAGKLEVKELVSQVEASMGNAARVAPYSVDEPAAPTADSTSTDGALHPPASRIPVPVSKTDAAVPPPSAAKPAHPKRRKRNGRQPKPQAR